MARRSRCGRSWACRRRRNAQVVWSRTRPCRRRRRKKDEERLAGDRHLNPFGSSNDDDFKTGTTRLTAFSFGKDGLFTATLADGEVWKQSPYDDIRAHWSGQPTSYVVIVTADMMGSHTMRVKGDHDYRVMRVK